MKPKTIKFKVNAKEKGGLVAIEGKSDIPFRIKRIYYVFGSKSGAIRGRHAYKNMKQLMICINGKCRLLSDDGRTRKVFTLSNRAEGIYLDKMTWSEVYGFSKDCILLIITNSHYNKLERIDNYERFVALANRK